MCWGQSEPFLKANPIYYLVEQVLKSLVPLKGNKPSQHVLSKGKVKCNEKIEMWG